MKVVILAAGYGTRLVKDIEDDRSGQYDNLKHLPKALLPIGGASLIDVWMRYFTSISSITNICVVINAYYEDYFREWAKAWPGIKLLCDGSTANENRKGAVTCMKLGIDVVGRNDDILIVAGDTLFSKNFPILDIIDTFYDDKDHEDNPVSLILYTHCPDEEVCKRGILETDESNRVIFFKEKPRLEDTSSRKQCPCFYILSEECLPFINIFLKENEGGSLQAIDAPGNFISYLIKKTTVYSYYVPKRFDVGSLSTYLDCCASFPKY